MRSSRSNSELPQLLDTLVALRMDLSKDGVPGKPADELSAEAIKTLCHLATVAIDTTKSIMAGDADTAKAAQLCPDWSLQGGHQVGTSPAGSSSTPSKIGGGNIPV